MKFYSDITNEVYETPEALEEAEAKYLETSIEEVDDVCEEIAEHLHVAVDEKPTKKQLAHNVEVADEKLKKANSELEIAQQKVEELSKEYLQMVDDILNPAKKAVADAQKEKYDAISAFNDQYGGYQVVYTGSRAAEEMLKCMNRLDAITRSAFRGFWL